MFSTVRIRGFVALLVLLAVVCTTTPISAADFSNPKTAFGSVKGVGPVEVVGEQISVGNRGFAQVSLANGRKLELDSLTKLTVVGNGQTTRLQMKSGNMGFVTKSGTLDITAGPYEITGTHNVTGNVAYIGDGFVGLRVKGGTATVRNLTTNQTVQVRAGQERIFSLQNADSRAPIAQLASVGTPERIPAAPQAPQQIASGNAGSTGKLSKWSKIAIVATVAGLVIALVVLSTPGTHTP